MKFSLKQRWDIKAVFVCLLASSLISCSFLNLKPSEEIEPLTQRLPFMVRIDDKDGVFRGTGFLVSKSGLILTVSHVVRYRDPIHVTVNGKDYLAETVFDDPILDMTLIRLEKDIENIDLPCFLDSDGIRNGSVVMVLGQQREGDVALVPGYLVSWASFRIWPGAYNEVFRIYPANSKNIPKPGFSGGPIFNAQKYIVGLFCCHENTDYHFYNGIPSTRILSRLRETRWIEELCVVTNDTPFLLPGYTFDINKV